MATANVVVLAGEVAAEPVLRRLPSGEDVTELRVSTGPGREGRRELPLPVAVFRADLSIRDLDALASVEKGSRVIVHGHLSRRFYRSGAGARSLTEVVASGIRLQSSEETAAGDVGPHRQGADEVAS